MASGCNVCREKRPKLVNCAHRSHSPGESLRGDAERTREYAKTLEPEPPPAPEARRTRRPTSDARIHSFTRASRRSSSAAGTPSRLASRCRRPLLRKRKRKRRRMGKHGQTMNKKRKTSQRAAKENGRALKLRKGGVDRNKIELRKVKRRRDRTPRDLPRASRVDPSSSGL